jgi:MoxR-like ATPase
LEAVVTRSDLLQLQALAAHVFLEDSVLDYILRLVAATRTEADFRAGVSVRGGLSLKHAVQARALLEGRDFVVPEDVQMLAGPVLAHRLNLVRPAADGMEERRLVAAALKRILAAIPSPA